MVAQLQASTLSQETGRSGYAHDHVAKHVGLKPVVPRVVPRIEGLVQVFTATHRNFFTSVMAQALRVAGQGTPVLVVQFLKGGVNQGHDRPVCLSQHLHWIRCNVAYCIDEGSIGPNEIAAVQCLWQHTQFAVLEGRYEFVVLDELSLAIHWGLISETEVLALVRKRPRHVELILTGPHMPQSLLDQADQVTELRYSHR